MISTAGVEAGVVMVGVTVVVVDGVYVSSTIPVERTEGCSFCRTGAQGCDFYKSGAKGSTFNRTGAKCSNFCKRGSLSHCGFDCRC